MYVCSASLKVWPLTYLISSSLAEVKVGIDILHGSTLRGGVKVMLASTGSL